MEEDQVGQGHNNTECVSVVQGHHGGEDEVERLCGKNQGEVRNQDQGIMAWLEG